MHGLVAPLSHSELDLLYGELPDYRPEAMSAAISGDQAIPVLCFNLVSPPAAEEHDPHYALQLRSLAERLNFPAEYVNSIK